MHQIHLVEFVFFHLQYLTLPRFFLSFFIIVLFHSQVTFVVLTDIVFVVGGVVGGVGDGACAVQVCCARDVQRFCCRFPSPVSVLF